MSTPVSNEKSINRLEDETMNVDGVLGGGKATPIITSEVGNETPIDVAVPGTILPDTNNGNETFVTDVNFQPIDGPISIT